MVSVTMRAMIDGHSRRQIIDVIVNGTHGTGMEAVEENPSDKSPGMVFGVVYPAGRLAATVTAPYDPPVPDLMQPTPDP
jgi:hypothetical protein